MGKGHGAEGMGQRAEGMEHGAWGVGQRGTPRLQLGQVGLGAWGMEHGAQGTPRLGSGQVGQSAGGQTSFRSG
ncbi:MAG: hypothetical protein K0B09_11855 [Bacteroidales bacterium]|nr:hypothetical protein [Bacteroidales bacterium]